MRSNPDPFSRWTFPPSWSAATNGLMPSVVLAAEAAAIAVRVWEALPPEPIRRRPPGFCARTTERSDEVMPWASIPVMISWAACSRRVSPVSFWSTQLGTGLLGVWLGVWLGVVGVLGGVSVEGAVVGVIGTDDEGIVLGPAVGGAESLQPASSSTTAAATAS